MTATQPGELPARVLDQRPDDFVLGVPAPTLRLADAADNRRVAVAFARQCRRRFRVFSRVLEPGVFDQPEFLDAIQAFALRSRYSRVQILLHNSEPVVRRSHGLVELARALSTYFEIRRPAEPHRQAADAFLLADDVGLLYRPFGDRYEGTADFHAPLQVRPLAERFEDMWQQSDPDPEMRRLYV